MPPVQLFQKFWLSYCALVLLLLSQGSSGCRTGNLQECLKAPFVPGHNLVGEGFDVVTLQRKGAYVSDVQTFLTPTNSCTLCENPFMGGELQKLPLSVLDWRATNRCNLQISGAVFSSVSSLLESSTSMIENDWKVGLNLKDVGLQLGGSKSEEVTFANSRLKVDKTYFSSHQLSCTHYSTRLPNLPSVNPDFHRHLLSLPKNNTVEAKQQYRNFIDTYGTHYIRNANLGGKFKRVTSIRTCLATLNRVLASQVNYCLNRGLKVGLGLADVSILGSNCRRILSNQDSVMNYTEGLMNHLTKVSGGNGWLGEVSLTKNDSQGFNSWLGSLKNNPDVISYSVFPLHQLAEDPDVRRNLQSAITQYIKDNGQLKKSPPWCFWNKPNLSLNCCPFKSQRGLLSVTVIRAWGLKGDLVGKTEGYVKVRYERHFRQTHWIRSNDPTWNQTYHLGNVYSGSRLRLEVWDKDVRYDDLLGGCSVSVISGEHRHVCGLNNGRFEFSYKLSCDQYLTGPSCNAYIPKP
ncbi:perforin-1-like [Astyanax mexicanus]|uniref:perforin-1-like n=1 Tax=Astyanax mexicanus TaxID=7994 RepID=UPI0020CB4717|nr:perforin-1-like [Astyanax mexicanus]